MESKAKSCRVRFLAVLIAFSIIKLIFEFNFRFLKVNANFLLKFSLNFSAPNDVYATIAFLQILDNFLNLNRFILFIDLGGFDFIGQIYFSKFAFLPN